MLTVSELAQAFARLDRARASIDDFMRGLERLTVGASMAAQNPFFEYVERKDGKFEWRCKDVNGKLVATSGGQGFRDVHDAARGAMNAAIDMDTAENSGDQRVVLLGGTVLDYKPKA